MNAAEHEVMTFAVELDRRSAGAPAGLCPAPAALSDHAAPSPRLEAVWAGHQDEVRAAQQLRWRVFVDEMGARLRPPPGTPPQHDADVFDAHCEHLLVRTVATADQASNVVGTYRVLTPSAARSLGGYYSESEFDILRLARLRPGLAELGRSCIDARWRQGAVMLMLWAQLAAFMQRNGVHHVIGCASVPMRDGGRSAADLWMGLRQTHLAALDRQVRPRLPLPVEQLATGAQVEAPPLIKGYLRCGGKVLGPPAWDPDFGSADLPIMLCLADMPASYRKRFIGA